MHVCVNVCLSSQQLAETLWAAGEEEAIRALSTVEGQTASLWPSLYDEERESEKAMWRRLKILSVSAHLAS